MAISLTGRSKHYFLSFLVQIAIAGFFLHPWDGFVMMSSVEDFLHGTTPYQTGAEGYPYIFTLGMENWYSYSPLPLLLFTPIFALYHFLPWDSPILARIFLKLPIILGNLLCAYLVYRTVKDISTPEKATKAEKILLYNPFLIFVGAVWGMFDVWVVDFLLLCLLRLRQGHVVRAGMYLALSLLVKPIVLMFVPVVLAFVWNRNRGIMKPCFFAIAIVATCAIICVPFYLSSPDGFVDRVIGEAATRPPGGCAPLSLLHVGKVLGDMRAIGGRYVSADAISAISSVLLAMTSLLLFLYLRFKREKREVELLGALFVAMIFFTFFSKVVNPQYFVILVVLCVVMIPSFDSYELFKGSLVRKYYFCIMVFLLASQFIEGRHFVLFIPADVAMWLFGKTGGQLDLLFAQNSPVSPNFYYAACQIAFVALVLPMYFVALVVLWTSIRRMVVSVARDALKSLPDSWLAERRSVLQNTVALLMVVALVIAPISAGVAASDGSGRAIVPPPPLGNKSVGVFYYYWWNNSTRDPERLNDNWTEAGLTPVDGYYEPNMSYMREDIRQMKQVGIDFAVVSLPDYEINVERYSAFCSEAEKESFCLAPMVEACALEIDMPYVGQEPFKPSAGMKNKMIEKLRTALDIKKSSSYLRFDGKPVVFLHTHPYFPAEGDLAHDWTFWSEVRAKIESEEGELFLVTDMAPGESWDVASPFDAGFYLPQLFWQGGTGDGQTLKEEGGRTAQLWDSGMPWCIATVLPYYNDLKINELGQEIPEFIDGRLTYDVFWEKAVEEEPDMVLIFAWNEYFESACIEPTEQFGDELLESTRYWTGEFKKT